MSETYRLAYIGNFVPEFSTENDYARAWENNGHKVTRYQEGDCERNRALTTAVKGAKRPDLIVWTRTPRLSRLTGPVLEGKLLDACHKHHVPIVGVHLDRWWGLDRQVEITDAPYFRVDLLMTADGAHQREWAKWGVNHRWLPPGVSEKWCQPGTPRPEFTSDIAFVGTHGKYHREWQHRRRMLSRLQERFKSRVAFWPKHGQPAIRGHDLTDLYWSTKLVVGDSCLVPTVTGQPMTRYCSDRIPETLGRGGILLHPEVAGITAEFGHQWWVLGDWSDLIVRCEELLDITDDMALTLREQAIERTREYHTYEKRVPEILRMMSEEGLL
jgi:hypothetical protein